MRDGAVMKIKTIHDVTDYLDNFYYQLDYDRSSKDRSVSKNGNPFIEHLLVADDRLFRNPEKTLARMIIARVQYSIENAEQMKKKEDENFKSNGWIIEWRIRPEYEAPNSTSNFARAYARFAVYQRVQS